MEWFPCLHVFPWIIKLTILHVCVRECIQCKHTCWESLQGEHSENNVIKEGSTHCLASLPLPCGRLINKHIGRPFQFPSQQFLQGLDTMDANQLWYHGLSLITTILISCHNILSWCIKRKWVKITSICELIIIHTI